MSKHDTPPELKTARLMSLDELGRDIPVGTTLYAVERTTSRSGNSRTLDMYVIRDGAPHKITARVAIALGWALSKGGTITVRGWNGDAHFCVAQALSYALHGMTNTPARRPGHTLGVEWL